MQKNKNCQTLLREYESQKKVYDCGKLNFNIEGKDVYNITAPFDFNGETLIAGRVESRESQISKVQFFKEDEDSWSRVYQNISFQNLQDPFVHIIDDELILGGVLTISDPLNKELIISWITVFYRGKTIEDLTYFTSGPLRMKDIRIVKLANKKIGIFTRPQGNQYFMGRIGYIEIDSIDSLNGQIICRAKIFDSHFADGEWGGVNEVHLLGKENLGILGHIAYWDNDKTRHYFAMAFIFNPETGFHTAPRIIGRRSDLEPGEYKSEKLRDVLFSGGLKRLKNNKSIIYMGVSDCEAHWLKINDPFDQ